VAAAKRIEMTQVGTYHPAAIAARAVFPAYKGRDFYVNKSEAVTMYDLGSHADSRHGVGKSSQWVAVAIRGGNVARIPLDEVPVRWLREPHPVIRELKTAVLSPDIALFRMKYFCGEPYEIVMYVHPEVPCEFRPEFAPM
jgi:hypothetical protein